MKSSCRLLAPILAMAVVSGCVRVDIGTHAPTLGEELIELYKAKQAGAITDLEFESLRHALILAVATG